MDRRQYLIRMGGAGWSLSWGSGILAMRLARKTGAIRGNMVPRRDGVLVQCKLETGNFNNADTVIDRAASEASVNALARLFAFRP